MFNPQPDSEEPVFDFRRIAGCRVGVLVASQDPGPGVDGARLGADEIFARLSAGEALAASGHAFGPALALAAFEYAPAEPAFALSVGAAVVQGFPTAERATITARTPLRDGVVEAQFGGPFARSFGRFFDVLLVFGEFPSRSVLHIEGNEASASLRLAGMPVDGQRAASTSNRAAAIRVESGESHVHVLTVGPGGDAGLPFANLASFDGLDLAAPANFVGRGGLGHSLHRSGVAALTVAADERADVPEPEESRALRALLVKSPRLLARNAGGTLELGHSRGANLGDVPSPKQATKHGCRGCPTPCGWTFDGPRAEAVGGRFSALQGFLGGADPVAAVAKCNDLGLDARAAALVLRSTGASSLDELVQVGTSAHAAAVSWSSSKDSEPGPTVHAVDLAAQVGILLAARGPEPVRSLSIFGFDTEGDPERSGELAYWHECFAAAVDLTGFCAFSAAGVIADRLLSVDSFARTIAPRAGWVQSAGAAMLGAGQAHVERHRRLKRGTLERQSDRRGDAAMESASEKENDIARAIGGYRAAIARGFSGSTPLAVDPRDAVDGAAAQTQTPGTGTGTGALQVTASGPLARRLEAALSGAGADQGPREGAGQGVESATIRIELPISAEGERLQDVLRRLAVARPQAASWLLTPDGVPVPAALRGGRPVQGGGLLRAGDEIELLLLIPGG